MALFSARYARALAQALANTKKEDASEIESHLAAFVEILAGSPDLREVMESPAIRSDEKLKVLDALLTRTGAKKDTLARNFLAVLIENSRMAFLPEMLDEFRAIIDAENGVVQALVMSAHPLNEEARKLVEKHIITLAGSDATSVNAQYSEDKSLLGGVVVRLGSTIYDGSVQGRLNRLKQELIQG